MLNLLPITAAVSGWVGDRSPARTGRTSVPAPDRLLDAAGPGGARRRAAVRPGRHRRGRPPRQGPARRARAGRRGAVGGDHPGQLPGVRHDGAGDRAAAVTEGVQASWLAVGFGLGFLLVAELFAGPLARALAGGTGEVAAAAETWLRIAAIGAPGILLTLAGNGWLRGVHDTARPLRYVLGANLLSAVLCPLLVYPAGLGLVGSAIANVVAQLVSAGFFVAALRAERVSPRPQPAVLLVQLRVGRDLVLRTVSFQVCFLSAAAVAARFGSAALGAHQIALQLWFFVALLLDSVAIAAQSLVGADLGAGRVAYARQTARRVSVLGGVAGLVLAVVTLGGFLPAIWLAYALDLGLGGIWAGLTLFVVVRLAALLVRLAGGRWAVPGRS